MPVQLSDLLVLGHNGKGRADHKTQTEPSHHKKTHKKRGEHGEGNVHKRAYCPLCSAMTLC